MPLNFAFTTCKVFTGPQRWSFHQFQPENDVLMFCLHQNCLNDAMQYGQEQHNYPRHNLSRAKWRTSCFFFSFLCTAEMRGYGFDLNGSRQVDQNHNHDTDFLTQPFLILSETPATGSVSHKSRMFHRHLSGCTNQLFY